MDSLYNFNDKCVDPEEMEFIGEWTYGKVYSISARLLMSNIYEALGKNDTFIIIKSPDYRIKCFYKNPTC